MRLDKYLKISRLIKRRTVANEACDAGRVLVNGKPARASYDVKVDDVLELHLGERVLKAQVLSVTEYAKKEEATSLYRIKDGFSTYTSPETRKGGMVYGRSAKTEAKSQPAVGGPRDPAGHWHFQGEFFQR